MPFPPSKMTYVRPLCENNEASIHQRSFASPIQHYKGSESNYLNGLAENNNPKNMDEVKRLYLENLNSVHSKLFAGVEEIQRWKTSIELESRQKNKKIEEILQTVELQRKVILDLQLQNENLSYQLSEEIQQRSFVIEKLHSTKELCSALKKHYNTLQGHYEYRNKIEEAVNAADAKRLRAIDNLKNNFEKVCREHSEKISYLNDALASETNKALNLKEAFEQQLAESENEKESLCNMIENCQRELQNLSKDIDEEKKKSRLANEEKNALKCNIQRLEELNEMQLSNLAEMKEAFKVIQNEKLETEKNLLSENIKMKKAQEDYEKCLETLKSQDKKSEEKMSILKESITNLECKIRHLETKVEEEKERNEILKLSISTLEKDKCHLDGVVSDARVELESFEQLKCECKVLEEQVSEFSQKEKLLNTALKNLEEEVQKYKSEKEIASALCMEKDKNLFRAVEEYQIKIVEAEEKLKYLGESNAEMQVQIKTLKDDLEVKSCMISEKDEKILSLISTINTNEKELEVLTYENITMKDSIEMEKNSVKVCLECEQLTKQLSEMKDLKITLQRSEEELRQQKIETMETIKTLNEMETSYNDDRMTKEREIIKFQEQVRRLEDEIRCMSVKLEELQALKSENQRAKDDIEELKLNAQKEQKKLKSENKHLKSDLEEIKSKHTKQEELMRLKSENEKLKEDLEDIKSKLQKVHDGEALNDNIDNKNFVIAEKQESQDMSAGKKNRKPLKSVEGNIKRTKKSYNQMQNKSPKGNVVDSAVTNNASLKENFIIPPLVVTLKDSDTDSSSAGGTSIMKKSNKQMKDQSPKGNVTDSAIIENANLKENLVKPPSIVMLKDSDTDSTSSEGTSFTKIQNNKLNSPNLEKNKWEIDSSGSEYMEIAYDKEKFMVLTPKKSPSVDVKPSLLGIKESPFNCSLKRSNQTNFSKNSVKQFGLPLKRNKTEFGNLPWMQPMRTPERNFDFLSSKENMQKKSSSITSTPSTPVGQRKFFKTPLVERDNKFKKPSSQIPWSDFLKSRK